MIIVRHYSRSVSAATLIYCGLALALLVAASSAAAASQRCLSSSGTTQLFVQSQGSGKPSVRVYTKPKGKGIRWYACLGPGGRPVELDTISGGSGGSLKFLQVRSPYVAFDSEMVNGAGDTDYSIVQSWKLTSRSATRVHGVEPEAPANTSGYSVDSLVLAANGAIAWMGHIGNSYDVRSSDDATFGTTSRILDQAPGIEPGSLALGGSTVFWTRAGIPQSAKLK